MLPHPPRDERRFPTADGPGAAHRQPRSRSCGCPPGRLLMQTIRSHDQYNTTIYGLDDRYRGIHQGRRVVFVNPRRPGRARRWPTATWSTWSASTRASSAVRRGFRVVAYPTARGCCATYFPETNVLVPLDSTAEISNTPTSKSVVVRLEPSARAT